VSPAADARWTRLLPRTLGARLVLVLLAGLLLAHALSFALLFHERAVATRSMMLANLERDAPVAVALLERVAPADRGTWLPRLERRTYRYLLRPARPGTELASDRAREVTDIIGAALGQRYALRPRAVSVSPERFEVELTLADGQPLTIEVTPSLMPVARWLPWVLAAQVLLLLACAMLAVRIVTRPLVRLADVAERMDIGNLATIASRPGLPREVAATAKALDALQARVVAHVAERMQILAAISHDLQTPITRMRLRLEAMEESPSQERLLQDAGHLSRLVREGIGYARSANVVPGPAVRLDLQSFLDSMIGDYEDSGRSVRTGARAVVAVYTHPQVVRRIVQNLIDNALAYAGSAVGAVGVDAGGAACIDVLDEGPGIPAASLEAVLQPFHRLESSRSRATGGTGLGLTIAQQLAVTLGGSLQLSNRDGGGLRATLAFH